MFCYKLQLWFSWTWLEAKALVAQLSSFSAFKLYSLEGKHKFQAYSSNHLYSEWKTSLYFALSALFDMFILF